MSNAAANGPTAGGLTVGDLIRWLEVRDLALAAVRPGANLRALGIYLRRDDGWWEAGDVPNGFEYPPQLRHGVNITLKAIFKKVIDQYDGPDPTTCPAFERLRLKAWREGEELDSRYVRRLIGELCVSQNVSPSEALSRRVDDLLPSTRKAAARGKGRLPQDKPLKPKDQLAALLIRLKDEGKLTLSLNGVLDYSKGTDAEAKAVRELVCGIKGSTRQRGGKGRPRTDSMVIDAALTAIRRRRKASNCPDAATTPVGVELSRSFFTARLRR